MSGSNSSDASSARAHGLLPETRTDHPLGLTVHNLPEAGNAVAHAQNTRHGRWKMLAVLLVCAAPVIASYFTYYVVRPDGRRNYGELIQPQRSLPDLAAVAPDGSPARLPALKGQWLLVSVGGGACDALCQQHLYLQRQLRESVGKEKGRVDWIWLVTDAAPLPADISPALQQATVLRVDGSALARWLEPAAGHTLAEHLYVVDPMGNWMMRFPAQMDTSGAAKAKRELERLLRASSSWDEAGRPGQPG